MWPVAARCLAGLRQALQRNRPEKPFGDTFRELRQAKVESDLAVRRERRVDRDLYSVANVPRLRRSIVCYLDTLGTKVRSKSLTNADLRQDIEDNDVLQDRLHSSFWRGATQRFVSFSDNVCVAAPIEAGHELDIIRDQVDAVATFQLAKVLAGRAIRGGITVGDIYCDSNFVDGPALIRAVQLEEKVAKWPRVLIEEDAADVIREQWAGKTRPWPFQLAAVDADGRLFVNYLRASGPHLVPDIRLQNHRDVVTTQLAIDHPEEVAEKWRWIAGYHNWVVHEFVNEGTELRIGGVRRRSCLRL